MNPVIRVNEIFHSIQGESTFVGLPCSFIRLTGCNLRCYYCDTQYAYEEGTELPLESILAKIEEFQCPLVAVTGGEPLAAKGIQDLIEILVSHDKQVLLETNGTLPIHGIPEEVAVILDIKCPSSGFSHQTHWDNLKVLSNKSQVKFVISNETDYQWALGILKQYKLPEKYPVLFSPASPQMEPKQLAEWILRDRLAVRLQLQLHKIIWGDKKRGV